MHPKTARRCFRPSSRSMLSHYLTLLILSFSSSLIVFRRGLGVLQLTRHKNIRSDWLTAARPETYQNLIHSNKDHNTPRLSTRQNKRPSTGNTSGYAERIQPEAPRSRGQSRSLRTETLLRSLSIQGQTKTPIQPNEQCLFQHAQERRTSTSAGHHKSPPGH